MKNDDINTVATNEEETAAEETHEQPNELDTQKSAALEVEEWRDKYLRKLAEFDNYRKRTRQETEQLRDAVMESVVSSLLPVLDDFDRMLVGMADSGDPYRKGVELIRGKLWSYFQSFGIERIECLGKAFDPAEHEALAVQPTPDFPPHTVMTVIAPGYRMKDHVIRHAQVVVSGEPDAESEIPK